MKDAKAWLKKIQEEESFAKRYKGLGNVKSIMEQAKKDGYKLNREDLNNLDLKKIAGGSTEVRVTTQSVSLNLTANGKGAQTTNNAQIYMFGGSKD